MGTTNLFKKRNKYGITSTKLDLDTEDDYYDDYADYDDGDYNPEDYQPIDFSIVDYDTQVEEIEAELEDLVGQLMEMRSLDTTSENEDSKYVLHKEEHKDDKKDKKAMEKLAILGFRRKNLGRKLTEDEKSTRKIIAEIKKHDPDFLANFQLKAARIRRIARQNRQLTRNQACNAISWCFFFFNFYEIL